MLKALIHQSELDLISQWVMDYPNLETGGDFFGFWTKEGYPVVQYVIGPGQNTTRSEVSFFQDIEYLKKCGNFLNGKYGLEHVGAWHSHHNLSLFQPSSGDVNTMRNLLNGGNIERFLISICNIVKNNPVSIRGFLFSKHNPNYYSDCKWGILDGISPIRDKLLRDRVDLFIPPVTKNAPISIYKNAISETKEIHQDGKDLSKPEMPNESYWKTDKGKYTLKELYGWFSKKSDISKLEMIQKPDTRIAFRFKYDDNLNEIILPHGYPVEPMELHIIHPSFFFQGPFFLRNKKKDIQVDIDSAVRYIEQTFNN